MPEIPIIIPLIIIGLVVGSILKSGNVRISKKKLASASLTAALLNFVHAYLLYSMTPAQSFVRPTRTPSGSIPSGSFTTTSMTSYVTASFLAGLLIVILVLGIATVYPRAIAMVHSRRHRVEEDLTETLDEVAEEESTLEPTLEQS